MITQATPEPRWTLESPLQEFMEAEYTTTVVGPVALSNWLADFAAFLRRPPVIGDLTNAMLDSFLAATKRAPARVRGIFRSVWRCAEKHVDMAEKSVSDRTETGVVYHGPAKWTKIETKKLLAASRTIGGTFTRRLPDGSIVKIKRAEWFAAYVRIARLTGLPWSRLQRITNGDITAGGMIVARPQKRRGAGSDAPRAYQLSGDALESLLPLRGSPTERLLATLADDEALRVYFQRLRDHAKLRATSGYKLIFGNSYGSRQIERTGEPTSKVIPLGQFTLDSSLAEFVTHCYLPQKIAIRSDKTREHYASAMRDFQIALARAPKVRDLTVENICKMLRWLESRELSPYTIMQRQNYLVALANFCSKRRVIDWWVDLPRYPTPDMMPDSWSVDDVKEVFSACDKMPGRYFDVKAATWWRAFHCVLWSTGERTSAVLAIEPQWFNPETRVLSIPGPARKGGLKAMTYDLLPPAAAALSPLLNASREAGRDLVFAYPGTTHSFYDHYKRLLKLAGLPQNRRCGPQKMRRTFATFVELAGGNATEALDHSCRRVTTESYLDPTVIRKPAANLLLPSLADESEGGAT